MAEVVGSGLLGDAWWECAGRRKASELPVGLLPLPRWVSFRPGLAPVMRVFKAPPPARWTAELKLRCDVFLETGPIAECDGGNIFRSKWANPVSPHGRGQTLGRARWCMELPRPPRNLPGYVNDILVDPNKKSVCNSIFFNMEKISITHNLMPNHWPPERQYKVEYYP